MTETRESWASRFGFIMATAGFAIGLGNIWRFSYVTGSNGGGAFLIIYLVLAVLIGIPLFTAEISLGRKSRLTPIAGMRKLTGKRGSFWNLIGWLGVGAAFLIETYYIVIMAWVTAYVVKTWSGAFVGMSPEQVQGAFDGFTANLGQVLIYGIASALVAGIVVMRGLQKGVETVAKYLMPVLFAFLLILAIGALFLPGAMEGVKWYLAPDWSKVGPLTLLAALGQAFFSIGVGMCAAFVYGSYLHPAESDIPGGAAIVVAFDTGAAFLAGLVIFPALFAFGLSPDSGPGLLFVSMTNMFVLAPGGQLIGGLFFFLVFIAGMTSLVAMLEALSATAMDSLGWTRRKAVWIVMLAIMIGSIPSTLSFGRWADVRVLGRTLFGFVDFVSGDIMLALGGLMIVLYTAYVWGFERYQRETNEGAHTIKVFSSWKPFIKYVIPVALAVLLLSAVGIIG